MGNGAAEAFPVLSKAGARGAEGWRSPLSCPWCQMAGASCWHQSCASCGVSASCLDPEFGHLGKLAMPTPVSDLNLGLAELFSLNFVFQCLPCSRRKPDKVSPPHSCPVCFTSLLSCFLPTGGVFSMDFLCFLPLLGWLLLLAACLEQNLLQYQ